MVTLQPGRRERSKAASRARIIERGIRLFTERGIDAVTVEEIGAPLTWPRERFTTTFALVEFEIAVADVDAASGVGVLLIKHVPPAAPQIRLNPEWMREH